MDQTASYCTALINQERGLEELQRHLRTTEDLFRESVKRKNQQLDLLQSEVRRLKTSVNSRDELTAAHMEQALGAQGGELQTLRERLSRRDAELDNLSAKMAGLEAALQTEEQRSAEATERAAVAEAARARSTESQGGELELLRERLADTQRALAAAEEARAQAEDEANAAHEQLAASRQGAQGDGEAVAAEVARRLQAEEALAEEREARASLEAQLARLEGGQAGGVGEADELRQHLSQAQDEAEAARQALAATEARAAETEARAARLENELTQASGAPAARRPTGRAAEALSAATPSFMQSTQQGSAPPAAPPPPAAAEEDEEDEDVPAVTQLALQTAQGGEPVMGADLVAKPSLTGNIDGPPQFLWSRGGKPMPHVTGDSYPLGAEDVGMEVTVRVTVQGPAGQVASRDATSSTVGVPEVVKTHLTESSVRQGERAFAVVMPSIGDKEGHVFFNAEKLKVQDKSRKKTLHKDAFKDVTMEMGTDDEGRLFTLHMKALVKQKPRGEQFRAKDRIERDLIYLTLQAFSNNPQWLARLPTAPGGVGLPIDIASTTLSGPSTSPDGPPSPTSSIASGVSGIGDAPPSEVGSQQGKKVSGSRTFSFGRKKKST